jgi:hypothetical protein
MKEYREYIDGNGKEFDSVEEWFESLESREQYDIIMEYDDTLHVYFMETFNDVYSEEFSTMNAIEIIDYVNTHFSQINVSDDYWAENSYGNLISDCDPLWLAEETGDMDMDDFWEFVEDNFEELSIK